MRKSGSKTWSLGPIPSLLIPHPITKKLIPVKRGHSQRFAKHLIRFKSGSQTSLWFAKEIKKSQESLLPIDFFERSRLTFLLTKEVGLKNFILEPKKIGLKETTFVLTRFNPTLVSFSTYRHFLQRLGAKDHLQLFRKIFLQNLEPLVLFSILGELIFDDDRSPSNCGFDFKTGEVIFYDFEFTFAKSYLKSPPQSLIHNRGFGDFWDLPATLWRYGRLKIRPQDLKRPLAKIKRGLAPEKIFSLFEKARLFDVELFHRSGGRIKENIGKKEARRIVSHLEILEGAVEENCRRFNRQLI